MKNTNIKLSGPMIFLIILVICVGISSVQTKLNRSKANTEAQMAPSLTPEEQAEQAKQAKIAQDQRVAELREYQKTPAGKLCVKHPGWTREECEQVVAGKYWIGMKAEMLTYKRGDPNHVNPSNYGSGESYQYCWTGWSPSCFYDINGDGIIDSYN